MMLKNFVSTKILYSVFCITLFSSFSFGVQAGVVGNAFSLLGPIIKAPTLPR